TSGTSRAVAVRALDELAVVSGETKLPNYMRELEAKDDSLMGFNILDCLKQIKELENIMLKALLDLIAHAEEAIRLKEGHVDFMDLEIDH
ncbi:hypothetical protein Tco_0839440, partial [Tanacetum coccineum]